MSKIYAGLGICLRAQLGNIVTTYYYYAAAGFERRRPSRAAQLTREIHRMSRDSLIKDDVPLTPYIDV